MGGLDTLFIDDLIQCETYTPQPPPPPPPDTQYTNATPRVRVYRVILEGAKWSGGINFVNYTNEPVYKWFYYNLIGEFADDSYIIDMMRFGRLTGASDDYWFYYHTLRDFWETDSGDMMVTESLLNHDDGYGWIGWTRGMSANSHQIVFNVEYLGIHRTDTQNLTHTDFEALPVINTFQVDSTIGYQPT